MSSGNLEFFGIKVDMNGPMARKLGLGEKRRKIVKSNSLGFHIILVCCLSEGLKEHRFFLDFFKQKMAMTVWAVKKLLKQVLTV